MSSTPIAFFIYNRPETTLKVFEAIKLVRPERLFIIGDGPKDDNDKKIVNQCRLIVNQVDWKCDLKIDFSEKNLGCAERIVSGLNWVFDQVDNAIILEDDCLPDSSFFSFCESLLEYYKFDDSIMHISGFNCLDSVEINESYFYSRFVIPPWGWATWKRAWLNFNKELDTWQQIKTWAFQNINPNYFADWTDMFENIKTNKTTWDVPWNMDVWKHNGLGIIPKKNLVQNIGFGPQATFTKNTTTDMAFIPGQSIDFPLVHPKEKITPFDNEIEDKIISALKLNSNTRL